MVLVDTSVWVEEIQGRLRIVDVVADAISICPPIFQEVLQGARPGRLYAIARSMLLHARMLDAPMPLEVFERAAQLYRRCQDGGLTLRSSADYLIATVALRHDAPVFTFDGDFTNIAKFVPELRLFTRS